MKLTHSGGLTVLIKTNSDIHFPDTLMFSVRDTGIGIGIDPVKLDYLSDSIKRGQWGGKQKTQSPGHSLLACQKLVVLMGGHIKIQSEEGLGSTFSFSLDVPLIASHLDATQDKLAPSLSDLVPGYLAHFQECFQQLIAARSASDLSRMQKIGHKLSGSGRAYSFEIISALGHNSNKRPRLATRTS